VGRAAALAFGLIGQEIRNIDSPPFVITADFISGSTSLIFFLKSREIAFILMLS
jgi:hypothetical protein